MALERLDGEEASYERINEAASSLPFLAPRKLVVLRRPGANKDFAEKFESFVEGVADTNDILIVEPKLDKRLSYYKQLKKLTEFREFAVLDGLQLARHAVDYAGQLGGTLSSSDARLLIDKVGSNQLIVEHEIEKLILHDPKISKADITQLTELLPQSTIFELLDAAFAGNSRGMSEVYEEQRALQVEPQQILAMLAWQLTVLAIVKTAGQRSPDDIAREAKLSPFWCVRPRGLRGASTTPGSSSSSHRCENSMSGSRANQSSRMRRCSISSFRLLHSPLPLNSHNHKCIAKNTNLCYHKHITP